jgi:hypothetical protein
LCCAEPQVCWGSTCLTPDRPCETADDCSGGELCDPDLGACVPSLGEECIYVPPVGVFEPVVACAWTSAGLVDPNRADVVAAPVVVNLTDDNGDGLTNREDTPDIAFLSYNFTGDGCCNVAATLRIVSGECNPDGTMRTLASIREPVLTNDTGIAAADLDGDGVPELVAIGRSDGGAGDKPGGTVAFRRTSADGTAWSVFWENADYPAWAVHTRGGPIISIANLDREGSPEVVIGNVVLDGLDGSLVWDGVVTSAGAGGIGNNAFLGPASVVADIDGDGPIEVIAGNTLYNTDGAPRWTFGYTSQNSACGGDLPCDGFNAVANFDADPQGEVVSVRRGEVFVLDHTGTQQWKVQIPVDDCANNESGPPTIADFDGDGQPEIGVASADYYVVVDHNTCNIDNFSDAGCHARNILWVLPNNDCSSRVTGSSVFDFDGDGNAEVVYADETALYIIDGRTGTVLYADTTHRSHTRIELPVIADVDNDGNAEIIVAENRAGGGTTPGLRVYEDRADNWVRTRRVWNQHTYAITHITEDGTAPTDLPSNWPRYNNFRQNVQPDRIFAAPDLTISDVDIQIASSKCPVSLELLARVTARNAGELSVPAGVPIDVEVLSSTTSVASERLRTTQRLSPGASEVFVLNVSVQAAISPPPYTLYGAIDPGGAVNECNEDNNVFLVEGIDCSFSD